MYYDIKESGKRIKELRKKAGMTQEALDSSVDYIAFGKKTLVVDGELPEEKVRAIMEFVKVMMG